MEFVTVAKVGDIPKGKTYWIEVGDRPILLIHDNNQFYALQGVCSHQGLSLTGAQVWRGVLDCPWHHFQFDICTGDNLYPQRVYPLNALPYLKAQVNALSAYPVRIVDQEIQVAIATDDETEALN